MEQLIGEQIYVPLQLSVMCAEDAPAMRVDPADAGTILGTEFVEYTLAQCAASWLRNAGQPWLGSGKSTNTVATG